MIQYRQFGRDTVSKDQGSARRFGKLIRYAAELGAR